MRDEAVLPTQRGRTTLPAGDQIQRRALFRPADISAGFRHASW